MWYCRYCNPVEYGKFPRWYNFFCTFLPGFLKKSDSFEIELMNSIVWENVEYKISLVYTLVQGKKVTELSLQKEYFKCVQFVLFSCILSEQARVNQLLLGMDYTHTHMPPLKIHSLLKWRTAVWNNSFCDVTRVVRGEGWNSWSDPGDCTHCPPTPRG